MNGDAGRTADRHNRTVRRFRVAAGGALSAHAPARGLRLGHRRLLVPRHPARRRHADHRDVGDERLPQGTAREDRRRERPYLRDPDRPPARRLHCGRGAAAKIQGIKLAIPLVEGQALASSQYANGGVLVRGISEADIKSIPFVGGNIKRGTLDGFDTAGGVAIGRRLADQLSLQPGDTITIVSPKGASTPFGTAPRIKAYPVQAVFEIGMTEFDGSFVFMPLTEARPISTATAT
jgi:hypothetical protein